VKRGGLVRPDAPGRSVMAQVIVGRRGARRRRKPRRLGRSAPLITLIVLSLLLLGLIPVAVIGWRALRTRMTPVQVVADSPRPTPARAAAPSLPPNRPAARPRTMDWAALGEFRRRQPPPRTTELMAQLDRVPEVLLEHSPGWMASELAGHAKE